MTDNFTAGKTAKSEQTRKRIVHTFLSLIEEKKWDKITVKELCARSEITRGTFYQYYSDIYELMEQNPVPDFRSKNFWKNLITNRRKI